MTAFQVTMLAIVGISLGFRVYFAVVDHRRRQRNR